MVMLHVSPLSPTPYFGINIMCNYHDLPTLSRDVKESIFLSINIQSLYSKHDKLVHLLSDFSAANILIDAIAVQEIWDIRYPELVNIPGFKPLIYKKRMNMRGGGVGFYIRENLSANVIEDLSP